MTDCLKVLFLRCSCSSCDSESTPSASLLKGTMATPRWQVAWIRLGAPSDTYINEIVVWRYPDRKEHTFFLAPPPPRSANGIVNRVLLIRVTYTLLFFTNLINSKIQLSLLDRHLPLLKGHTYSTICSRLIDGSPKHHGSQICFDLK